MSNITTTWYYQITDVKGNVYNDEREPQIGELVLDILTPGRVGTVVEKFDNIKHRCKILWNGEEKKPEYIFTPYVPLQEIRTNIKCG